MRLICSGPAHTGGIFCKPTVVPNGVNPRRRHQVRLMPSRIWKTKFEGLAMIDASITTLIATGVALTVGTAGVLTSLYSVQRSRLTSLELQYAGERSKALVRVVQLMETSGRAATNKAFNMTEARRDYDDVTGEPGNPYGPERRPNAERNPADEADAGALIAAYGSFETDKAFYVWVTALETVYQEFEVAEIDYFEHQMPPSASKFTIPIMNEISARTNLRKIIRDTIRVPESTGLRLPRNK